MARPDGASMTVGNAQSPKEGFTRSRAAEAEELQVPVPISPKPTVVVSVAPPAEPPPALIATASPSAAAHHHPSLHFRILDKLKQHNIGRVVVLYIGVCWVILDPVHVVFHMLGVPEWANRLVVVAMALGFPVAVVTAWIYHVTPAGLAPATLDERRSLLRRTSSRLNRAIAAVAALLAVYFLVYHFWLAKHLTAPLSESSAQADAEVVPDAVPPRSIAVLPFVDMSQARDQQYLADGLAEELLNLLAQIPELRVAARTSAFAFKNKPQDVTGVAKDLRVANVLEGSVRKAGNRVRVTAELIRADSGYELWTETYDGTLDDIFTLQDQIAGAVVQALKVKLLGGTLPDRAAPTNLEAYNLYLQGRFLAGRRTQEGFAQSLDALRHALQLDQSYEPLWTELSIVYGDMATSGFMSPGEALPKARDAAQRAIELNPKSARAHVALAYLHMDDDWNWAEADREIRQALTLEPGSADVLHAAGSLDLVLGRVNDGVKLLQAALERDPVRASTYYNLGVAYAAAGQLDDAERAFRRSIQLRPALPYVRNALGLVLLWRGQLQAALQEMNGEADPMWRLQGLAIVYTAMNRGADSDKALAGLISKFQKESPYAVATVYGYRGEVDQAFAWLDRALAARDAYLPSIKSDPLLRKLQPDPRYAALLKKAGLPP
jgi:adenylate cyclase